MILFRNLTTAALALSLLAACSKTETPPPVTTPVQPTNPTNPTNPTTPPNPTTPTGQYGTPFAGVPNREDAVIYQVNMRAFSQAGNFAGITARLDSIRALNVNVIYLMPIYPVGQATGTHPAYNSPYAVQDYQAVNAEFGTLADLRALVDAAHAKGMAVLLDWVANHTSWDNAWITAHPDWYQQNANGNIIIPPGTNYNDVAQLNYTNQAMRAAMIAALKSWVYTANVDGFRCDYADGVPADFWAQANDTLHHIATHKLLLLAEGTRAANFSSGFDYNFGFNFYGGLRSVYRANGAATTFTSLNTSEYGGASGTQQVVRYTTNHDVNGSDGTPVGQLGGDAGAMSAFVVAALFKGVPMIYNGQEAGMTTPITFPFTSVKVRWGAHPAITRAYKNLLAARAASPALQHGAPAAYSTTNVCAFTKTVGSDQALVLANVRGTAQTFALPTALDNSTWTDALQGGAVTLSSSVALPPYGYLVLKK